MPAFKFVGPYPVVLPARGQLVDPGDVVDFDEPPNRIDWQPADAVPPASLPEPPVSDKKKEG